MDDSMGAGVNRAERRRAARAERRHGPWCSECEGPMVLRHPDDDCHLHGDDGEAITPHCCGALMVHGEDVGVCSLDRCAGPGMAHKVHVYVDCAGAGTCPVCS